MNGVPDFSPWGFDAGGKPPAQFDLPGTHEFSNSGRGMADIHKYIAKTYDGKVKSQEAVKIWMRDNGLTAHHFTDGKIQIVPKKIHDRLSHLGGSAEAARNAS